MIVQLEVVVMIIEVLALTIFTMDTSLLVNLDQIIDLTSYMRKMIYFT